MATTEEMLSSLVTLIDQVQNQRMATQAQLIDALGRFELAKGEEDAAVNTQVLTAGEISALRAQLIECTAEEQKYKEQLANLQALLAITSGATEQPTEPEEPLPQGDNENPDEPLPEGEPPIEGEVSGE